MATWAGAAAVLVLVLAVLPSFSSSTSSSTSSSSTSTTSMMCQESMIMPIQDSSKVQYLSEQSALFLTIIMASPLLVLSLLLAGGAISKCGKS